MQIVQQVKNLLNINPLVRYEWQSPGLLTVYASTTAKQLSVAFGDKEHVLFFNGCQSHFPYSNEKELLDALTAILGNTARIKVLKQGVRTIASELDLPNSPGFHYSSLNTSLSGFKVHRRTYLTYQVVQFT